MSVVLNPPIYQESEPIISMVGGIKEEADLTEPGLSVVPKYG